MAKIIRIQPKERDDMTLPYPYFIDEKGKVGRQDFWKGKPRKLIGFDISPTDHGRSGKSVPFARFFEQPELCIGMYPIFEQVGGKWITYGDPIESYSVNDNGK